MWEKIRYIFLIIIRNLILLFVLLELFFRFVVPASSQPMSYFYEADRMYAYLKNQDGVNTIGKTAGIRAKWHINNQGWNYPFDYHKTDKKLIAVMGSSYVAALEVDCDKKYPYLLREKLGKDYEVYAFGHQGAPVSQHLWVSRYVDKYFNPDIFIFDIADESLGCSTFESKREQQYLTLSVDTNGKINENAPKPNYSFQQYKPYKKFFFKSAFFRYLFFNLKLNSYRQNLKSKPSQPIALNVLKSREPIAEYLFKTIRDENKDKRIIFVIIPTSKIIYYPAEKDEEFCSFREMVKTIAARHNIEVIDLTEPMQEDYRKNKQKFDFEIDSHWNEYGHRFVASILAKYLQNSKLPGLSSVKVSDTIGSF